MIAPRTPTVVVLGMMSRMPVAGVVWQTLHYLVGLRRLGFDVHYVEAHASTPVMFCRDKGDDGAEAAARFLDSILRRFDFADRWAFHALHGDGRVWGMSTGRLAAVYEGADVLLNLHGGTEPLPEHVATGRLVFVGTDPVQLEIELFHDNRETVRLLDAHFCHFTFGENYGQPDCGLPVTPLFDLHPTRQPVVLDFWTPPQGADTGVFTTIGNWRQRVRDIRFRGETYHWSKDLEFAKILDLPERTGKSFELALSSYEPQDAEQLESRGWRVRSALSFSTDADAYRTYIARSRGELTVAKDQNVRLRSGWFSDRSATYLAAGRPVVTQDTGFGSVLPTGAGLHAFATLDDAVEAVERVDADYARERDAAFTVARDCFDHRVVLTSMWERIGASLPNHRRTRLEAPPTPLDSVDGGSEEPGGVGLPSSLPLDVLSRHPVKLGEEAVRAAARVRVTRRHPPGRARPDEPKASIVIVTHGQEVFTRLCLASVLANTKWQDYEVVVVDNASRDGTVAFLTRLAREEPCVRVVLNERNEGFAAATNRGVEQADGELLVLLNNDTVVPEGWLTRLATHLDDPSVGAVGPVTNRIGNEAEIAVTYRTYGEMTRFAERRAVREAGSSFDIPTLTMFCLAIRRATFLRIGPLDESFGLGTLEDDDYSVRLRRAGLRLLCAEDAFVHHFGQASFGELVESGAYGRLLEANQERFARKWGRPWQAYARRPDPEYVRLTTAIHTLVGEHVPRESTVLVVSRGDEGLIAFPDHHGWHVPQGHDGIYAGFYPGTSEEAIAHVETLRAQGGGYLLFPRTSAWWLEHYSGLRAHLDHHYRAVVQDGDTCTLYDLTGAAP